VASPEEVARAVVYVATERHMTGSILSIDGGYTAA
jgi:NAD(P)-dependent dehydrogenase (short-subunit alcohol dehydrogenase family)